MPAIATFDRRSERYLIETAADERQRLVRFLDREFPGGEPIAMPVGWDIGVETDRPVYGLQVTAQRATVEAALEMIPRYGIVAAVIDPRASLGKEFGGVFSRTFPRYQAVGNWVVFFDPERRTRD